MAKRNQSIGKAVMAAAWVCALPAGAFAAEPNDPAAAKALRTCRETRATTIEAHRKAQQESARIADTVHRIADRFRERNQRFTVFSAEDNFMMTLVDVKKELDFADCSSSPDTPIWKGEPTPKKTTKADQSYWYYLLRPAAICESKGLFGFWPKSQPHPLKSRSLTLHVSSWSTGHLEICFHEGTSSVCRPVGGWDFEHGAATATLQTLGGDPLASIDTFEQGTLKSTAVAPLGKWLKDALPQECHALLLQYDGYDTSRADEQKEPAPDGSPTPSFTPTQIPTSTQAPAPAPSQAPAPAPAPLSISAPLPEPTTPSARKLSPNRLDYEEAVDDLRRLEASLRGQVTDAWICSAVCVQTKAGGSVRPALITGNSRYELYRLAKGRCAAKQGVLVAPKPWSAEALTETHALESCRETKHDPAPGPRSANLPPGSPMTTAVQQVTQVPHAAQKTLRAPSAPCQPDEQARAARQLTEAKARVDGAMRLLREHTPKAFKAPASAKKPAPDFLASLDADGLLKLVPPLTGHLERIEAALGRMHALWDARKSVDHVNPRWGGGNCTTQGIQPILEELKSLKQDLAAQEAKIRDQLFAYFEDTPLASKTDAPFYNYCFGREFLDNGRPLIQRSTEAVQALRYDLLKALEQMSEEQSQSERQLVDIAQTQAEACKSISTHTLSGKVSPEAGPAISDTTTPWELKSGTGQ